MKTATLLVVISSFSILSINALRFEKRWTPGVVSFNLHKRTPQTFLDKRFGEVSVQDTNYQHELLYVVQLLVGTPPQTMSVQLDTGSSDLILETGQSDICSGTPPTPCQNLGAYNANFSSTYQYIDSQFKVAYPQGAATGDWVSDNVDISGAVLQNLPLGVMYKTTIPQGILGVGYPILESRVQEFGYYPYDNFPIQLVKSGYIASRAFSLWTNDDRADGGTLLFGGIDTGKFSGQLVTLDLVASGFNGYTDIIDFTVVVQGVSATDESSNNVVLAAGTTPFPVLMDSGSMYTFLPPALAQAIWDLVGATASGSNPNMGSITCAATSSKKMVIFSFQGISISAPMTQLVVSPVGGGSCVFGIAKGSGSYIIGDTVLAAMYVVYDLDNNQISLAPTVYNSQVTNIMQIVAGPNGVPDRSSSTSPSSTSSSSSSTSSSTASSTTSSSSTLSSSTLSSSTLSSSTSSSTASSSTTSSSSSRLSSSTSASNTSTRTSVTSTSSSRMSLSSTSSKPSLTTSTTSPTSCKPTSTLTIPPATCTKYHSVIDFIKIFYPAVATKFCSSFLSVAATMIPPKTTPNAGVAYLEASYSSEVRSACSCVVTQIQVIKCPTK